jgi:hypothetical protein
MQGYLVISLALKFADCRFYRVLKSAVIGFISFELQVLIFLCTWILLRL